MLTLPSARPPRRLRRGLGAIYGLHEFSHRFLGVDPLWFWKDIAPAPLAAFAPAPRSIESGASLFRYRDWFINDEDLLGRWHPPAGERLMGATACPEKVFRNEKLDPPFPDRWASPALARLVSRRREDGHRHPPSPRRPPVPRNPIWSVALIESRRSVRRPRAIRAQTPSEPKAEASTPCSRLM